MTLRLRGYLLEDEEIGREKTRIGPFDVWILRDKGSKPSKKFLEFIKRDIPEVVRDLKRVGIKGVKLPTLAIADQGLDREAPGSLGLHIKGTDTIFVVGAFGMNASTLRHELGHNIFEHLPQRARKYWHEVVTPRNTTITKRDVEGFIKKYLPNKSFMKLDYDKKQEYVRKREKDLRLSSVYQELCGKFSVWSTDKKQIRAKLREQVGNKIFISHVPFSLFHYAATNPREAFSEFFNEYLKKGPRGVDPGMRSVFKNVMGSGGHRLENTVLRQRGYLEELKGEADFYPSMYRRNKGIFYRGSGKGGKGIGMGALGKGIYVTWHKGMAKAFAQHHKQGGKVEAYKLKAGLKMLDSKSEFMSKVKKEMGFDSWEYTDDPAFASMITMRAKKAGFDGVVSDNLAEGIVVFDAKNVKKV